MYKICDQFIIYYRSKTFFCMYDIKILITNHYIRISPPFDRMLNSNNIEIINKIGNQMDNYLMYIN